MTENLHVVVHYAELGLKGKNRPFFERQLAKNIRAVLTELGPVQTKRFWGRLLVTIPASTPFAEVRKRLQPLFGMAYFAPVRVVSQAWDDIQEAVLEQARLLLDPDTSFRVKAHRGDKRFPLISPEIGRQLGAAIVAMTGSPVDLQSPAVTIYVNIQVEHAYIFAEKIPGAGGLPVGVTGRVMGLLSGGIDSPVAAHLMLKRGCKVDFVHFHALRSAEEAANSKIVELARHVITPQGIPAQVHLVPYHPFQMRLLTNESRYELVIFRRFMARVAQDLARQHHAQAIVTGDNLGQVASQTLENLVAVEEAVEMPIFRPLLCFDKQEIIGLAQQLGTFDLSVQPYKDCCSIVDRHPATRVRADQLTEIESAIDFPQLIADSLAETTTVRV
ncbi:MAG: tRNA 4-thiouridine(8) synthase ThiI [Chloroflexi bacterium]|nr:tRNA 4-thiouridine(8) synthase ThiI [Chloroflexota bacterium]